MALNSPSLERVANLLATERSRQLTHLEELDSKAGIALGFAGLIVTLAAGMPAPWRILSALAAIGAAGFALGAFWPRGHPTLDAGVVVRYATSEEVFLLQTIVDVDEHAIKVTSRSLETKRRRLRLALLLIAASGTFVGVGAMLSMKGG